MAVLCDRCGTSNNDEDNFCYGCGKVLNRDLIPDGLKTLAPKSKIAGRYEVLELLNTGGMGAVYKIKDSLSGEIFALKELLNLSGSDVDQETAIMRFKREAEILSSLRHANLPFVKDYFTIKNRYYLIMEFIDGIDLIGVMNLSCGSFIPEDKVVKWSIEICDVLDYLHSKKPPIIYRDIKPSNIMIRHSDEQAVLVDFGIARVVEDLDSSDQITKTSIGTMGYVSPEQARGKPEPRSDIYSLGATMHHLLTGKPPLPYTFPSLAKDRSEITHRLNSIVMTAVRLEPKERFSSAIEMKLSLSGRLKVEMPPLTADLDEINIQLLQLESDSNSVRMHAAKNLARLKTEMAVPALIKVLDIERDPETRQSVVESLAKYSHNARVPDILKRTLRQDPFEEVRATAAMVIGRLDEKETFIDSLLRALEDPSVNVRLNVIRTLGEMKEKEALEPLSSFLVNSSEIIRDEAVAAIGKIDPLYLDRLRSDKESTNKSVSLRTLLFVFISLVALIFGVVFLKGFFLKGHNNQKLEDYFEEGKKSLELKNLIEAREFFKKMVEIDATDGRAYYGIGSTYLDEDTEKALENFNKAITLSPKFLDSYLTLSNYYSEINDLDKVKFYMEKAKDAVPENPEVYLILGKACYDAGDYQKAYITLQTCSVRFPDSEQGVIAKQILEYMEQNNLK